MLAPTYTQGELRLLKAADLVENSETFDMSTFMHECGTPACILGHYALACKDRWKIVYGYPTLQQLESLSRYPAFASAAIEFDISLTDSRILFGSKGCDDARTGAEAAAFIRNFVSQRVRARLQEP